MSGDGTDRNGAGEPDESADGTDWLLSQLDEDETGAIDTQPSADPVEDAPTPVAAEPFIAEPFIPSPAWASNSAASSDDRTQVLPVVPDSELPEAPGETAPAVPETPLPEAPAAAAAAAAAASVPEVSGIPAAPAEPRLHPSALQLPVVPPTAPPAAPVPPVLNELTVDTDSVLLHAPAGTFRAAPTNPVVLPPVDDEPWSLSADEDAAESIAPEDVETAVLPIAHALAANDPTAWASVEAEADGAEPAVTSAAAPAAPATPPLPAAAARAAAAAAVTTPGAAAAPDAVTPDAAVPAAEVADEPSSTDEQDAASEASSEAPAEDAAIDEADLPSESWSLSETFGDDVLDGENVEVRDAVVEEPVAPATPTADAESTTEPRIDPLAWLTEPFGETFGATTAAPSVDPVTDQLAAPAESGLVVDSEPESPLAGPVLDVAAPETPTPVDEADDLGATGVAADDPAENSELVDVTGASWNTAQVPVADVEAVDTSEVTGDSVAPEPEVDAAPAPLRWDSPAPSTPAIPAAALSPADVPWPDAAPEDDSDPLQETRPFDSLGGPGPLVSPQAPTEVGASALVADAASDDAGAAETASPSETSVPPAFGPPTPTAERSITELISLDGVQPAPTVSPFGEEPFVWDLAPNDALDPLVHAAPTTQPIAVPLVQWEAAEPEAAVSTDSPSELAHEGEVPDAAFVAGDLEPFAPGLAATTLGRPLLDGPGDEFGSWTEETVEPETAAETPAKPETPAPTNETVDLFPTLSLGGLDARLDAAAGATGLAVAGAAAAGNADAHDDPAADDDHEVEPTEAGPESSPTAEVPRYAVDPEELDDEFDEEIVEFDAVPLSAAGVPPLPSFVPEDAEPIEPGVVDAVDDATEALPSEQAPESFEPEPVSEELRLESLFDLGPDTDLVDVVSSPATEPIATEPASDELLDASEAAASQAPTDADAPIGSTPPTPSPAEEPVVSAEDIAPAAATSLADTFAAEGGWSLQADAAAEPDLPLAPVPGLVAASGTEIDSASPVEAPVVPSTTAEVPVTTAPVPVAPASELQVADLAADATQDPLEDASPQPRVDPIVPASTLAFGSGIGASAVAAPVVRPDVPAEQTAPAALPGETVAFPELQTSGSLGDASPAAGVLGASLPPQASEAAPERDLPPYRGEPADRGIPKALIWTVVGLGAAVLLLLAFYFGTLVGAANVAAGESVSVPAASALQLPTGSDPSVG